MKSLTFAVLVLVLLMIANEALQLFVNVVTVADWVLPRVLV